MPQVLIPITPCFGGLHSLNVSAKRVKFIAQLNTGFKSATQIAHAFQPLVVTPQRFHLFITSTVITRQ
ncbi:hypothetical protein D3C85_1719950 [compost metagenome]